MLRIEETTLSITPTADPNIVQVSADVTKDDTTVKNPKMHHVTVLWNTTTPKSAVKDAMRAAIKEDILQADLKAAICEAVISPAQAAPEQPINIIINAASVTVIQAMKAEAIEAEPVIIERETPTGGV
jgi:hypothetical protein